MSNKIQSFNNKEGCISVVINKIVGIKRVNNKISVYFGTFSPLVLTADSDGEAIKWESRIITSLKSSDNLTKY